MRDAPTRTKACVIPITALATVFAVASCTLHRAPVYTDDASPSKLERACQAVDEATGVEMTRTDRAWCRDMMQAWYSETWYTRPDPADQFTGVNQLRYLQAKADGLSKARRYLRTDRGGPMGGRHAVPCHRADVIMPPMAQSPPSGA